MRGEFWSLFLGTGQVMVSPLPLPARTWSETTFFSPNSQARPVFLRFPPSGFPARSIAPTLLSANTEPGTAHICPHSSTFLSRHSVPRLPRLQTCGLNSDLECSYSAYGGCRPPFSSNNVLPFTLQHVLSSYTPCSVHRAGRQVKRGFLPHETQVRGLALPRKSAFLFPWRMLICSAHPRVAGTQARPAPRAG